MIEAIANPAIVSPAAYVAPLLVKKRKKRRRGSAAASALVVGSIVILSDGTRCKVLAFDSQGNPVWGC